MARIEELIDEVADPRLRDQLAREVKELKAQKRFGLVFERHMPESVLLHGFPVRAGSIVQKRREPENHIRYEVKSLDGDEAVLAAVGEAEATERVATDDLLTVKRHDETIYPGLIPVAGGGRSIAA